MTTPALQKLFNDIDALIPLNLRHIPGQREGLVVRLGTSGVYLSHVDMTGCIPKNFVSQHRDWMRKSLLAKFPHLDASAILGRSSESIRRFNSIEGRLSLAQEGAKNGRVIAIESLDMSGKTPRPIIPASQLTAAEPGKIPRAITWVQIDPAPARRVIVFSDMPMVDKLFNKRIIPDEITVSYLVSDDELKAIKAAKPPAFTSFNKLDDAVKRAKDVRMVCGDINKELINEQLVEHFQKTLRGLVTAADTIFSAFGITPDGKISAMAGDSYLHSGEAKIIDPNYASIQRRTEAGTKVSMTLELEPKVVGGAFEYVPTKLEPVFSGSAVKAANRIGLMMVAAATAFEDVLKSLPKKPPKV
jgi:hypothetical protein